MSELHLGTSGWSYKELVGVFYPSDDTNKLSYYSKYFDTVEIDSTFYAYPAKGLPFGWARYTPENFVFAAKLPKLLTHQKRLDPEKGIRADLLRFLDLMKPLITAEKLGPVLIQLPPSFNYENDFRVLKNFLEILPRDINFAVEFRHPSWLRAETWDLLEKEGIADTIVDEPLLPPDTVVTSPDLAFVRWHGHGKSPWYNYRYTDKQLEEWKPRLDEVTKKAKKTYGYFNNHFNGFAIENSLKMMKIVGTATAEQLKLLRQVSKRIDERLEAKKVEGRQAKLPTAPTRSS